ncbi:MAG: hypothetical protein K9L62_16310 [Vallitaleaceae bacterium]|nr:hypothetical protein [Vallitaleaceae bacterium]
MDEKLRIKKLEELRNAKHEPYAYKEFTYKNNRSKMEVFLIPVDSLIFNQYNGRIGTYVKTYEKQHGPIDASTTEGEKLIVNFLWNSKKQRNEETERDIIEKGQLEYGIVTSDGIIIDGNRRCMILKKIALENHKTPTYFKAVILEDTYANNTKEIRMLETTYQMGVDERVDYNAIEKYLKCKDLITDFTLYEIAKMMGIFKRDGSPDPKPIQEYLEILNLMEEYLKRYDYEGMYTRLNEETVEGPFVDLKNYLSRHERGNVQDRDWDPQPDDLDDLKQIYFDYIRAGFRSAHGIREIGNTSKGKGIFSNKSLWESFSNKYFDEIEEGINREEPSLEDYRKKNPTEDVEKLISARDKDWVNKVKNKMTNNLNHMRSKLDDLNQKNAPLILLEKALSSLQAVDTEVSTFDESLLPIVKEIGNISYGFQKEIKKKIKGKEKQSK